MPGGLNSGFPNDHRASAVFEKRNSLMIKDHRPYLIKKAYLKFQKFYTRHFLRPQLAFLGRGFTFMGGFVG